MKNSVCNCSAVLQMFTLKGHVSGHCRRKKKQVPSQRYLLVIISHLGRLMFYSAVARLRLRACLFDLLVNGVSDHSVSEGKKGRIHNVNHNKL